MSLRPSTAPRWSFRWGDLLVGAGVGGGVLGLFLLFRTLGPPRPSIPYDLLLRRVTLACALWALLTPFVLALAERFPFEPASWRRRVALYVVLALLTALALDLATQHLVVPPPRGEASATGDERLPPQDRPVLPAPIRILGHMIMFGSLLAAGHARAYLARSRSREAEAARLTALLASAHLDALRMQLNPHFLFNTLNAVSALAERDPAGVRRVVARLSGLLRRVLDNTDAQEVPLAEELAFLDDYLDIQRFRLGDRLATVVDVPPDVRGALVPALVLQPLVENAVEHGVARLEDRAGTVRISAWREGTTLAVTVSDDGPGGAVQADGIGLSNTRARLHALYGPATTLDTGTGAAGGFSATIRLPFHTTPIAS
ncbi:MAG TPA: histidine kinase [Rhodothermales bacterium]|nr:histidine kinase [Rhodothermales bacterium]